MVGLLVDQSGFPLGLHSFEGNTAETKTILPVVKTFCDQQIIVSQYPEFRVIYQYREKRAVLDKRNIQKQIDKAEKFSSRGLATDNFLSLKAKTKQLNHALIDKAYALAGIKWYVTNLGIPNQQVILLKHI